jgi:mannose-6-phosphate isomerase-like protein (cupin superfamily)
MSDYTIKNLMELDDALSERDAGIEARFARKHLDSDHLGVSHFRYAPGERMPFAHSHKEQEEVYVVVSGTGRVKLDDDIVDLRPWDVVRVAPQVIRSFEAGPDGLEIIAIGADRPDEGDGVMAAEGWWPAGE